MALNIQGWMVSAPKTWSRDREDCSKEQTGKKGEAGLQDAEIQKPENRFIKPEKGCRRARIQQVVVKCLQAQRSETIQKLIWQGAPG